MATRSAATATLTHHSETAPVVAEIERELSGAQWVDRFPGSSSVDDLNPDFAAKVGKFISAIRATGASVRVSATFRPKERAYLMHYSAAIAKGTIAAARVPRMDGVNIEWQHDSDKESQSAASSMAAGYRIVYPPALSSRHTEKAAIDMTITGLIGKTMKNASGEDIEIKNNEDIFSVGATYRVIKLVSDPPHWSDNGQ
jgi:D-alanyl-D-alanine dipeptidase